MYCELSIAVNHARGQIPVHTQSTLVAAATAFIVLRFGLVLAALAFLVPFFFALAFIFGMCVSATALVLFLFMLVVVISTTATVMVSHVVTLF